MHLLFFIIINALASLFQAIVGIGHALIANPLSLTFLSKSTTLSAVMVVGTLLSLFLTRKIKEPLAMDTFKPLLAGSIIGMPFGVVLLKTLPINDLRVFIGLVSILSAVALQTTKIKVRNPAVLVPATGILCGVLQTSTGITGPPLAIMLTGLGVSKNSSRKIMAAFFLVISIITLFLYLLSGILQTKGVVYGLCAVPFIFLATHYGNKIADHVPHKWYRTLVLATVGVTGAYAIYVGLH